MSNDEIDLLVDLALSIEENLARKNVDDVMRLYRSEQRRLQTVLDTVADGIITIDSSGMIQLANPAAKRLFGYELEELIGKNVDMLMPQPSVHEHESRCR